MPGAPPSLPIPLNLTPDATGLKDWTFDDFDKLMSTGIRKNGKQLDPFMPIECLAQLRRRRDARALGVPAHAASAPFGGR